ncbi:MAG: tRNA (guanosine(37)-N1)-methyltransferase TrmD [Dehalococcoidia bacterium]|jgi:tRNA (guanine37-N1)-methyltransferase
MRIDVATLFPEMFAGVFELGIMKRAIDRGLVSLGLHNIRDYTHDKHHTADDYPYGGGAGMVLKPEPIFEAVEAIAKKKKTPIVLLSPQGRLFTHQVARELAKQPQLVLICGHYEGIDERVREHLASDEISIGDYVLSGGELAAMVVIDSVFRLVPGVLGSEASPLDDSHAGGLLEYPQYTRPPQYRGWEVPEILLSGNHAQIDGWRREQAIRRTLAQRPELLNKAELSSDEERLVERLRQA